MKQQSHHGLLDPLNCSGSGEYRSVDMFGGSSQAEDDDHCRRLLLVTLTKV
jgi:hypothetical protein